MSVTLDLHPMPTYLHATVTGEYAAEEMKRVLAAIVSAGQRHRLLNLLIDCQGVTGDPTLRERFEMVSFALQPRINALIEGRKIGFRTAVVGTPPLIHPARYGMRLLVERNLKVTVCERLEEALAWLGVEAGVDQQPAGPSP
ncbi:MAG TPA: STAS/SEC14 domain-containing protein [Alphaproteobacteria bacterium]